MVPVAKDVKLVLRPLNGVKIKTIYGYESLKPDANGVFEISVGELNADDWRVFIAEIDGSSATQGLISPFQIHLSYVSAAPVARAKKTMISASLNWHPASTVRPKLNPTVTRNSVILADAMTLIKVSELSRAENFKEASQVLALQITNLRVTQLEKPDSELAKEEQTLTAVKVIIDRRAQEGAAVIPENSVRANEPSTSVDSAVNPKVHALLKGAAGFASSVIPGPWGLIFSLFHSVL